MVSGRVRDDFRYDIEGSNSRGEDRRRKKMAIFADVVQDYDVELTRLRSFRRLGLLISHIRHRPQGV